MAHPRLVRPNLLAASLVTALAVLLTGCTADARVTVVQEQIQATAARATPLMIGVLAPDVAKVLAAAGDETSVMMPILAPDLTTATATVAAESPTSELFRTPEEAAEALEGVGIGAWIDWLEANKDAVSYVETSIPVRFSPKGETLSAGVDEDALRIFAEPIEQANLELFVQASEATQQWQRTMAIAHAADFLPQVTGLTGAAMVSAVFDSVAPAGDGRFVVSVRHPDPEATIRYQAEKALESYGTGKIWGEVTRKEFAARMVSVEIPESAVPELTSQATVKVSTTQEGSYSLLESLAANLAAQSVRYRAEAEPGSFAPPPDLDRIRTEAIDAALAELAKRTIAEQKRPGTKLLVGGKSGSQVTINTGGNADKHITFFKWGTKKQAASAFVKAGKSIKLRLPAGSYRLVYASGEHWYGKRYSFGPTGNYQEFKTDPTSNKPLKIKVQRNYVYTVSIETGGGGSGSVSSGSTDNPFEE